uniref:aminotransferase class V-fold PLP-dependent enzyme n=1 Tax=Herbidospora sakaeratensis TaxID=564415 RepID=UPI0007862402|nr:aminotransferase class V-fold PLP-dependent enzyme [Herbidospora sakaeratensis]
MTLSRRAMLTGLPLSLMARPAAAVARPVGAPAEVARDEVYWRSVAAAFRVDPGFVNLENGYFGSMPEPVRLAYHAHSDRLNAENSRLLRTAYRQHAEEAAARVAGLLGVTKEEIAFTRGGTEALQNLITGYRRLAPGDAVMYADLDFHTGQSALRWLADRHGARVERLVIPEPATRQAVLDAYAAALATTPRLRLLLLSHLNNRTGLVVPVAEITEMAREKGVDVIVDAAHSWGHLDFTLPELKADFGVFSLHKWMGAPLGSGFLYIRKERLADVAPVFGDESQQADIRSRVHSGTMDVAPILSVGAALDFHETLGAKVKEARLRHLRERWVDQVRDLPVEILTPDDPAMYGGMTAFRLAGRTSKADNTAVVDHLYTRHRIFTVHRDGVTKGDCVRVTPALFTSAADVDRLAAALRELAGR